MAISRRVQDKRNTKDKLEKPVKDKDEMTNSLSEEFSDSKELANDDDDDNDDDEGDILEDDNSKIKIIKICVAAGIILILVIVIIFLTTNKKTPPEPEPEQIIEEVAPVDTEAIDKQNLYESGIGKEYINEIKIYEQGNLESPKFRKDFQSQDQPEMFVLPVKIQIVKDSISYIKHRAQMDEGLEIYWLEGKYKGKNCMLTIPYSIYQSIADEGAIDVNVEVVTDKTGSQTITNISAIAPQKTK